MAKSYLQPQRRNRPPTDDSAAGFLAAAGGFFAAYLTAEALLADRMHPLHWVIAAAGACAGWLLVIVIKKLQNTLGDGAR